MPNIHKPEFEEGERPQGFKSRRARIGYELATELIGCSLFEVPPGQAAYPYHFHYADEELLVLLSGEPSLRTPEGTRTLAEGEVVHFPLGEEGAHQVFNSTDQTVTFLALSRRRRPTERRCRRRTNGDRVGCDAEAGGPRASATPTRRPGSTGSTFWSP